MTSRAIIATSRSACRCCASPISSMISTASGIYESVMKGITVLAHAPKTCDRRALLVFTNAYLRHQHPRP